MFIYIYKKMQCADCACEEDTKTKNRDENSACTEMPISDSF